MSVFKTIQLKLFFSYSLIIILLVITFIATFYLYVAEILESKASETMYNRAKYISNQLDVELKNMNITSQKIVFSDMIKELFFEDLVQADNLSIYNNTTKLQNIVYSILGPTMPVHQINIFDFKGRYIGIGSNSTASFIDPDKIKNISWVDNTIKYDGSKLIIPPHADDFGNTGKKLISLCRGFAIDIAHGITAIIEVQQDYDTISGIIHNSISDSTEKVSEYERVYVYDEAGSLVYPLNNDYIETHEEYMENRKLYWELSKASDKNKNKLVVKNTNNSSNEIMVQTYSDFSKWTVIAVQSDNVLLRPVIALRNNTFLVGITILLIMMVLSFIVAKGLTIPIKRIHKSIKNLNLESLSQKTATDINSGLNELEALNLSFIDMCERLKESLEEAVLSRSHKIQARMLALQSQMNPHFLYNSLTIIGILGEERKCDEIVKVCGDLSSMLRYISSNSYSDVYLYQEIDHTMSFLKLMKKRYGDHLEFKIDIPDELMCIKLPKLLIQPLVENCTKHGLNKTPPFFITVVGKITDKGWNICINDNGQGFSEDKLGEISERLNKIDNVDALPHINLEGMGLINIYTRLKLLYGEKAVFRLENNSDGGATVTIGELSEN